MKRTYLFFFFIFFLSIFASPNFALSETLKIRWENQYGLTDDLAVILKTINLSHSLKLQTTDFIETERKTMATARVTTYQQVYENAIVEGTSLRAWSDLFDGHLIQLEAWIDENPALTRLKIFEKFSALESAGLTEKQMLAQIQLKLNNRDDNQIQSINSANVWVGSDYAKKFTLVAKRGTYTVIFSKLSKSIQSITYKPFPNYDIPAQVYPIWEESESLKPLTRTSVVLKNLLPVRKNLENDPFALLKSRQFLTSKIDNLKAGTQEGLNEGYWSEAWLKGVINSITDLIPTTNNSFSDGNQPYLIGKYATIQLHPLAVKLAGINFPLKKSALLTGDYRQIDNPDGTKEWAFSLADSYLGKPLANDQDALLRPARRLPDHNVLSYINDGFDEVQVYYAIDTLMEVLQKHGFTDPDLSTRPFNAFLYNTDIEAKDNAYYNNDTINFATYSPDQPNYARDNTTIWHELGHGIMDRLMGAQIQLADTGGLSEGMADFVAQLILNDVTQGQDFDGRSDLRIMNATGFYLSNEEHDDGEAYGGAMNDILELSIKKWGFVSGLHKMSDLTLEAMRFTRNHPGLTATDWFSHMLFVDKLGKVGTREPSEMSDVIRQALSSRNFNFTNQKNAELVVFDGDHNLDSKEKGSRYNPYAHALNGPDKEVTYNLEISLEDGEEYKFKYPLKIKVQYIGWALQGAIQWKDEQAGPKEFTLTQASEKISLPVTALTSNCEFVNREDGGCSDYVYVTVVENGKTQPVAKKRFYVRLKP